LASSDNSPRVLPPFEAGDSQLPVRRSFQVRATEAIVLGGEFKKAQAQAGTVPSSRTGSRDEFITRLSCARTASMALSVVDMPVKEKVKELFHLAEEP